MPEGLNRATVIGNCGEVELRFTQSNQAILSLSVCSEESFFDSNTKERKTRKDWHKVCVWGKRGEALSKILEKGSRVCIEGRMQTTSWEDKNGGGKRYKTEIVANNVILLGGGNGKGRQDSDSTNGGANTGSDDAEGFSDDGSEIPF